MVMENKKTKNNKDSNSNDKSHFNSGIISTKNKINIGVIKNG